MIESHVKYDEQRLDEIRKWLESDKQPDDSLPDCWVDEALQYCVNLIEQLKDENESVWYMLEENQRSVWTKEHSEELQNTISRHIALLKLTQANRGEA